MICILTGKVEICGVNTSRLPVLSEDKKRELFKKIRQGDKEARREFICGNLRLVLSVIKRFSGKCENTDDLFQVGCIGLIKALDNFDLSHGVRFSTYAVPMIIGEIRRYLRDNTPIRVSRSLRDVAYKALSAKERLICKNSKEPTLDEIAAETGIPRRDICAALDAICDPVSLHEPVYHDGADAIFVMDQVKDEKNLDDFWLEEISLREALSKLPPREKSILELRFYRGRTQMEIANEIGISQAQVSRLEKNALGHMRRYL